MTEYAVSPYPTESLIKVAVNYGDYTTYTVSWNAQPGAIGYNVLGSPSPITKNRIESGQNLPSSQLSFTLQLPFVPQDVIFNFWVETLLMGDVDPVLIQENPATVFDNENPFPPSNPPLGSCKVDCAGEMNLPSEMMGYYLEEMRGRNASILQNDGEPFTLFLRRWSGVPCRCTGIEVITFEFSQTSVYQVTSSGDEIMIPPMKLVVSIPDAVSTLAIQVSNTDNFTASGYIKIDAEIIKYTGKTVTTLTGITRGKAGSVAKAHTIESSLDPNLDPNYNVAMGRCELCYGTGIAGGYWSSLDITAIYGGEGSERPIAFVSRGAELQYTFPSWTLWLPRLHEHDLLVRNLTGERFEVVGIYELRWRGAPLIQRFKTIKLQPGDIRYKITDSGIENGLNDAYILNPNRFDMTIFS